MCFRKAKAFHWPELRIKGQVIIFNRDIFYQITSWQSNVLGSPDPLPGIFMSKYFNLKTRSELNLSVVYFRIRKSFIHARNPQRALKEKLFVSNKYVYLKLEMKEHIKYDTHLVLEVLQMSHIMRHRFELHILQASHVASNNKKEEEFYLNFSLLNSFSLFPFIPSWVSSSERSAAEVDTGNSSFRTGIILQ